MMGLDQTQLHVLRILLEERSVSRAAARLGVSQPAVSAQLRRLREALGDPLLVRSGSGLVPTPRGASIQGAVVDVLDGMRRIIEGDREAFDPAAWHGTVNIAAVDYVQAVVLPSLLDRLSRRAPSLLVSVRPLFAPDLARQFENDEVQLALMPTGNAPAGARARKLFDEAFVCAVRRGHPVLEGDFDVDAYCRLAHVLVSPTRFDFRGVVDRELRKSGRARSVRVSVPSFHLAANLVARSDDVATLPAGFVNLHRDRLAALKPPVSVPGFSIAAVWHERTHRHAGLTWLRSEVVQVAAGAPLQTASSAQ